MDYLEGTLLHAWWSDTDYESRRHTGTWFWFSLFTFISIAYAALRLNLDGRLWILEQNRLWLMLGISLFLLTPLLCLVYYKVPFLLRVPILALLLLKYAAFFLLMIGQVARLLVIPEDLTIPAILEWGNNTFGDFLEDTSNRMGVTGLFVGGGLLVLIGIGIALAILAVIIFVPILMLKAFNAFQYLYDSLIVWIIRSIRRLIRSYRHLPQDANAGPKMPAERKRLPNPERRNAGSSPTMQN